jgi:hypothetical protein
LFRPLQRTDMILVAIIFAFSGYQFIEGKRLWKISYIVFPSFDTVEKSSRLCRSAKLRFHITRCVAFSPNPIPAECWTHRSAAQEWLVLHRRSPHPRKKKKSVVEVTATLSRSLRDLPSRHHPLARLRPLTTHHPQREISRHALLLRLPIRSLLFIRALP